MLKKCIEQLGSAFGSKEDLLLHLKTNAIRRRVVVTTSALICFLAVPMSFGSQNGVPFQNDIVPTLANINHSHCTTPTYSCENHDCVTGMQINIPWLSFGVCCSVVTGGGTQIKTCQPAEGALTCWPYWNQCSTETIMLGGCPGTSTVATIKLYSIAC